MTTPYTQATPESVWAILERTAQRETDKTLAELEKTCIQNDTEYLTKQYFYDTLSNVPRFANVIVCKNEHMCRGNIEDCFDILLLSDSYVAIIETKYRVHTNDLEPLTTKKVENFRVLYPEYANHKLYLGIASMSFNDAVINEAKKLGLGILKQKGETIECDPDNIKAY
jgi:hypothetical protein